MSLSAIGKKSQIKGLHRICKGILMKTFSSIEYGVLTLCDSEGEYKFEGCINPGKVVAQITIQDPSAYTDMVLGGSIGAGESYMSGDWTSPNLTNVIRLMSVNLGAVEQIDSGIALISKPIQLAYHLKNRNTEKGSRRNIAAHYDLGNEMFKLFLDPTMMYSSAIFPTNTSTLEQGSNYKLERICQKLQLKESDHLMEIGTGWGGMAIYAAKHYGCKVTTTTISKQQFDYAKENIEQAGVSHLVTLLMEDYRNISGKYDKLVSIEMIEAVGHQYYPDYFQSVGQLLNENGLALIQAITIDDKRYENAKNNIDFIQRYIFPGACLPSIKALLQASGKHSNMQLSHLEDITPHYAKTLHMWRENFFEKIDQIRKLGYNEEFIRMWDFYFCYCEAGFREHIIGDVQMVFTKPHYRGNSILGTL
jgi:cyclopropane-fatty-acyl-phospholipid synthase